MLTVKSGSGIQRAELEVEIDEKQFDVLWPATEGCRVEKVRWTGVLECGAVFELDLFEGDLAPLLLVEVEFQNLAEAEDFVPPDWFGRDVTDNVAYTNVALAIHGVPPG